MLRDILATKGAPLSRREWHREDIKAALRKRYGTLAALSTSLGMGPMAVSQALQNDRSRVVERRIAEALQVPLHELWPERWNPDGTSRPRSRRVSGDRSRMATPGKRQKGAAA